jgi:uncharacterized protein (TIGR03382 family)
MSRNFKIFLVGVLFSPLLILLHEGGHYTAAASLRLKARLHFGHVGTTYPLPVPVREQRLVTAAGPAVESTLALVGMLWLWLRRRRRRQEAATPQDWAATYLVLCVGRWLRAFVGTPAHPLPRDEAFLSASLGFPEWLFPCLLAPAALVMLATAIRLHPPGQRLAPFGSAFLGGGLGAFLWLKVLGPQILP